MRCSSRARTSSTFPRPGCSNLFLAAIGEARDRGVKAIETFGYRYPEGSTSYERVLVHRTVFPADFLADFGFVATRWEEMSAWHGSIWAGWCRSRTS